MFSLMPSHVGTNGVAQRWQEPVSSTKRRMLWMGFLDKHGAAIAGEALGKNDFQ